MSHLFVTGTDTEIGKTWVSCAILKALRATGRRAVGMKPVAAGAHDGPSGWVNEDVEALIKVSDPVPREQVNPFLFPRFAAPEFAAAEQGGRITPGPIVSAWAHLAQQYDHVVVEGVGGWAVPLAPGFELADLPRMMNLPVVLVVGLRLGVINHARLTERAILGDGLPLLGWVSNHCDPAYEDVADTRATLARHLTSPCLGHVAHKALINTDSNHPDTNLGALLKALLN